jgi:thiol-disulfide isomerase/thioredoxin
LLIKDVVGRYGGRVGFVSEDWGRSELAARYEIKRYPVVFVGDVLVAQPKDFGGWGDPTGKYAPWSDRTNQARFQEDVARVVDLLLRGDAAAAARAGSEAEAAADVAALPAASLVDLAGRRVETSDLAGQVVVVEFWATWCAPCRGTLRWLGSVERRYGKDVTVLAVAVQSPEADVRKLVASLGLPVTVVPNGDEVAAKFGGFSSVPVLYVFDRGGKTAQIFHGAPKDLHERAGRLVDRLVRARR